MRRVKVKSRIAFRRTVIQRALFLLCVCAAGGAVVPSGVAGQEGGCWWCKPCDEDPDYKIRQQNPTTSALPVDPPTTTSHDRFTNRMMNPPRS